MSGMELKIKPDKTNSVPSIIWVLSQKSICELIKSQNQFVKTEVLLFFFALLLFFITLEIVYFVLTLCYEQKHFSH